MLFQNREDAGRQLGEALKGYHFRNPLVVGIPRGGVVTAAAITDVLPAEMDVILTHKLRCPGQPELAIGAVGEEGEMYLHEDAIRRLGISQAYLQREYARQMDEIHRRKDLLRKVRPAASLQGRSVIITDDGIATGATMLAAVQVVRGRQARDITIAVPVAPREQLAQLDRQCDRVVCLHIPDEFWAVGEFYRSFDPVTDSQVIELLREAQLATTLRTANLNSDQSSPAI